MMFVRSPFGIIVTGGEAPSIQIVGEYFPRAGLVVAADQGYRHCREWGIHPDALIGDMDSLSEDEKRSISDSNECGIRRIEYPVDKDLTDTELAVSYVKESGIARYVIIGGGEGLLDHLLAILSLFNRDCYPQCWVTARESVFLLTQKTILHDMYNRRVSFFPMGASPSLISSSGLAWELNGIPFEHGMMSVSNRGTRSDVELVPITGKTLVLVEH